ncbi:MAG: YcjX family protein [Deltaproteobacteria bacterium]|nr:YcjX family protein [Deltaproteobacteria bacterium]
MIKPTQIQQVGIVVTKSDMVATNDDIDNLESLARQMTYKKLRGISVESYDFFTCSTVMSTEVVGRNPPRLKGRLVYNERGERVAENDSVPVEFVPSRVPELWPQDSEWNEFNFPEVYPKISARRDTPPQQEGLDRVVKSMLGL